MPRNILHLYLYICTKPLTYRVLRDMREEHRGRCSQMAHPTCTKTFINIKIENYFLLWRWWITRNRNDIFAWTLQTTDCNRVYSVISPPLRNFATNLYYVPTDISRISFIINIWKLFWSKLITENKRRFKRLTAKSK